MADNDRWNDRHYRDPERERARRMRNEPDYGQTDYGGGYGSDYRGEYSYGRPRGDFERGEDRLRERDDHRFAPFGSSGPVAGRGGAYDDKGEPYGARWRSGWDEGRHAYGGAYDRDRDPYRGYGRQRDDSAETPYYDQPRRGEYRSSDDRLEDRARRAGQEARSWWDRTTDKVQSFFGGDDADEPRYGGYAQGEHRGRGPKGYRRSDERIREDVSDRLTEDPFLDASDIDVQVSESEVTLSGAVDRREDKRRAENLAEAVSGVTHVQNNLRVREGGQGRAGLGMQTPSF